MNMKKLPAISVTVLVIFLTVTASIQCCTAKGVKVAGTWNYSAPEAPYEYSKGQIIISENNDTLEGVVNMNGYEIKMNNLKLEKDVLSFSIYVEGEYVSVKLTFDKDTFEGTANTPEGQIEVTGEKEK